MILNQEQAQLLILDILIKYFYISETFKSTECHLNIKTKMYLSTNETLINVDFSAI